MKWCSLVLPFLVVLNIKDSIRHPFKDNLPKSNHQDNGDDENGFLTDEDFENANIQYNWFSQVKLNQGIGFDRYCGKIKDKSASMGL